MNRDDKVLSELHTMLGTRAFLQGSGLVGRLAKRMDWHELDVKQSLGRLARSGTVTGVTVQGDVHQRVSVTVAAPAKPVPMSLTLWEAAMKRVGLSPADVQALGPCHDRISDFSDVDMEALAAGLLDLRQAAPCEAGTPKFVLSARYLLGSSKLLGQLPALALFAFGLNLKAHPDAPPYVITAGPADPDAVVLVENPHAFDAAVAAGAASRVAFVVTFGYGLSRNGEDFGNQLLASVAYGDGLIGLVREGQPPQPAKLLSHPRIYFWGDLDREGLRIYAGLRQRVPQLRLSALYRPMIAAFHTGDSHPYAKATCKDKQAASRVPPDDGRDLIELCGLRAVDQEYVSIDDIRNLCGRALT